MHNILIKNNGDYEMRAVDTENENGILDCIEEYMGAEFANYIRPRFTTKIEIMEKELDSVQNELNEATEEADWAKDELEETTDKLREKEKTMQSVMKGLEELAERLGNSKPTMDELDIIKKDIKEMTDALKLELE